MIPPDANADFVAAMEDVLEVYKRPHDPQFPVVCLDEASEATDWRNPHADSASSQDTPRRHDYEYERNGTANLFMMFAPLEGWRHVKVTDRHTAVDFAQVLKELSDTHFPEAKKICLVMDNLNTHKPASLYEAFPAAEARRLFERFEWHYTPKHGSWLDMAETELSVLSSQCLDRRIPDMQTLIGEVAAWEKSRNKRHTKADWQFTTAKARIKLKRLYPPRGPYLEFGAIRRHRVFIPFQANAGGVENMQHSIGDFIRLCRTGSAQSCHSSQCAVSVTRMTWAATSG